MEDAASSGERNESTNALYVDFIGTEFSVDPGSELTFGRLADIVVDDNPHLHRTLGRFTWRPELWWLVNEGRHIALDVHDLATRSSLVVAPGGSVPLTFSSCRIRFEASITSYELLVDVPSLIDTEIPSPAGQMVETGEDTVSAHDVPMTDDQRALVHSVATPVLSGRAMPTSRELAAELGWSQSKFERKLDNVCQKLSRLGVRGLHGGQGKAAKDRKTRLAEYAIQTGLVSNGS